MIKQVANDCCSGTSAPRTRREIADFLESQKGSTLGEVGCRLEASTLQGISRDSLKNSVDALLHARHSYHELRNGSVRTVQERLACATRLKEALAKCRAELRVCMRLGGGTEDPSVQLIDRLERGLYRRLRREAPEMFFAQIAKLALTDRPTFAAGYDSSLCTSWQGTFAEGYSGLRLTLVPRQSFVPPREELLQPNRSVPETVTPLGECRYMKVAPAVAQVRESSSSNHRESLVTTGPFLRTCVAHAARVANSVRRALGSRALWSCVSYLFGTSVAGNAEAIDVHLSKPAPSGGEVTAVALRIEVVNASREQMICPSIASPERATEWQSFDFCARQVSPLLDPPSVCVGHEAACDSGEGVAASNGADGSNRLIPTRHFADQLDSPTALSSCESTVRTEIGEPALLGDEAIVALSKVQNSPSLASERMQGVTADSQQPPPAPPHRTERSPIEWHVGGPSQGGSSAGLSMLGRIVHDSVLPNVSAQELSIGVNSSGDGVVALKTQVAGYGVHAAVMRSRDEREATYVGVDLVGVGSRLTGARLHTGVLATGERTTAIVDGRAAWTVDTGIGNLTLKGGVGLYPLSAPEGEPVTNVRSGLKYSSELWFEGYPKMVGAKGGYLSYGLGLMTEGTSRAFEGVRRYEASIGYTQPLVARPLQTFDIIGKTRLSIGGDAEFHPWGRLSPGGWLDSGVESRLKNSYLSVKSRIAQYSDGENNAQVVIGFEQVVPWGGIKNPLRVGVEFQHTLRGDGYRDSSTFPVKNGVRLFLSKKF